jgi:uncharacterized metal-binding protein YceD (DUF177 family)
MTELEAPFSRIYRVADVPSDGLSVDDLATKHERRKTAELLDVLSVDRLEFRANIVPVGDGAYDVTGSVSARLAQTCVITLEPIVVDIDNAISVRFLPDEKLHAEEGEDLDPEERDLEPLGDGVMDIGQLAYEHLVIALDPYPKSAGSEFDWKGSDRDGAEDEDKPFSALRQLKER